MDEESVEIIIPPEFESTPRCLFELSNISEDPRQESFFKSLSQCCCPYFEYQSFTFASNLILIIFFVMLVTNGTLEYNGELLKVSDSTLIRFGACDPYLIRQNYEFYRIFTAMFLHRDYIQLVSNILAQTIIGSFIEQRYSRRRCALTWFLSGMGGSVSSMLCTDIIYVGANACIFGYLGTFLSYMLQMANGTPQSRQILLIIIIYLGINISFGFFIPSLNVFAHSGGILTGFMLGFIFRGSRINKFTFVAFGLLTIFFFGGLYIFYTFRNPLP